LEFEEFELERVRRQIHALEGRNWLWSGVALLAVVGIAGGLLGVLWLGTDSAEKILFLTRGQMTSILYVVGVVVASYHLHLVIRNRELLRVKTELLLETLKNEISRLQGMVDPLTRVYNRQSMEELLSKWIQRSERYNQVFSLAVVDLDDFKAINDKYGHLTGDFVLSEVAGILRSSVRGSDLVIRYGGDEFLLVLSETDQPGAQAVIRRVHKLVTQWNQEHAAAPYEISVSLGLSIFQKGKTARQLISEADREMYLEKQGHSAGTTPLPS
jgi:diguanylate cyclase (GGDEF)-like protein